MDKTILLSVTSPLHDSRLHWVHDPQPHQTPSVPPSRPPASTVNHPMPRINDSVPRTSNTVPRNIYPPPRTESTETSVTPSSDVRVRAPLTHIESSVLHNSSQQICPPVPRNNTTGKSTSATATTPTPIQEEEKSCTAKSERERRAC